MGRNAELYNETVGKTSEFKSEALMATRYSTTHAEEESPVSPVIQSHTKSSDNNIFS
jgi:hypothetical protein